MKILANDGISPAAADLLRQNGLELLEHKVAQEQLANFLNENRIDALLVRSATKVRKELIDQVPSLKIIGRGGVGMDNIDVEYARGKGLTLINTPTASSRSVAEMVFAHFFALARYLHESNRMMPLEGEFKFNELKKSYASAVELQGKTLGIIGLGTIGKEVARIGLALGMKVRAFGKEERTESLDLTFFNGQKVFFELKVETNLEKFLPEIDFLTLHTPKTETYLLDADQFELMKEGAFIVNTARGGVLNEVALVDFLADGKIAGAALDVFENEPHPELPLLMNPKISLTPHLAGSTREAQEKIGLELAEQLVELSKNFSL